MNKVIIFCLLCSGCAPVSQSLNTSIPIEVQSYVNTFEHQNGVVEGVTWKFDDLPSPVIGRCTLPQKLLELDNTFWKNSSDVQKEEVVLHELGHCILNRAHLNTVEANNMPISMMNAYIVDQDTYSSNRKYYLNELSDVTNVPMITAIEEKKVWDN